MKSTPLTLAIDRAIEVKLMAIDRLVEELVEPLESVGNPEKLIGKDYESWTPEDLNMMTGVYGTKEPNLLSNLIFRKLYEKVQELESEVK